MDPVFFLMILISGFIMASFIMDLYLVETYGDDDINYIDIQYENYSWFIMCQLTNLEPFYDCPESVDGYFDASGEEWMIFTLDLEKFQDPANETVYGYAVYSKDLDLKISPAEPLSLCNFFPEFNQTERLCEMNYLVWGGDSPDTCYSPYPCTSVLEHELKHLKCKCNWHEGLESERIVIII